jgi:hypothetical protein
MADARLPEPLRGYVMDEFRSRMSTQFVDDLAEIDSEFKGWAERRSQR